MSNPHGKYVYDFARPSVTADIVIVSLELEPRVLLIRRADEPFQGAWALPGGFVDPDETLAEAAHRELQEETGVTGVHLEQLGAFGDPGRDPRGWTVTVAFLARLDRSAVKPKAGDDAAAVKWHPLDRPPKKLAFDHDKILARARARLAAFAAG
jgi:8-oxo-dGTP diphosphatase